MSRRRNPPMNAAPAPEPDFYETLEVPRTASADAIRRAYKRLALKWHPDKNPENRAMAEEKFKEISRAYEVLGSDQMRSMYDQYGLAGLEGGAPSSGAREEYFGGFGGGPSFHFHDPFQIFRQFFGDGAMGSMFNDDDDDDFFGMNRRRSNRGNRQRRDPFGFGGFGMMDMFEDDYGSGMGFGGGMGGMGFGGGMAGGGTTFSMSSFTSSSSGMPGQSSAQSVSQSTQVVNGRKVTRTVKKTLDRNGNVHEDVDEQVEDLPRNIENRSDAYRGAPRAIESNRGTRRRH